MKVFDSELKVMDLLWANGDMTAKDIAAELTIQVKWSKTTTYTIIKKCIDKKIIERRDPHFMCHALITREETQEAETADLINKMYDGCSDMLVASILENKRLTHGELENLKKIVADFMKDKK